MKPLSSMLNPEDYWPGLWNLRNDPAAANHWSEVFRLNTEFIANLIESIKNEKKADEYRKKMTNASRGILDGEYATVHGVTLTRQKVLDEIGVPDPFLSIKDKENEEAITLLKSLRGAPEENRCFFSLAVECLLAGNCFDMGNYETAVMWKKGELGFSYPKNPKNRDDLFDKLSELKNKSCVMLADNAGHDFTLGIVFLSKALARNGYKVAVAANSGPALNDVTFIECLTVSEKISAFDTEWKEFNDSGIIDFVETGCITPGIDLSAVDEKFDVEVSRTGVVIFTGQGRSIETTYNASLSKPVLRIAKIKDSFVASYLKKRQFGDFVETRGL
ncbi:DUF89 family protein [candidate division WOR-3 bacterium]|nr:DUF89 family protein [candidate division WOR-3 bacterium]